MPVESNIFNKLMEFHRNPETKEEKKMKPSEKLLKGIKDFGFDMSQLETVLKTRGNQLILSSAGSGKTTSLIFKVIYDQKTGYASKLVNVNGNDIRMTDSTWVCTFLRSGAEELKSSLIKWQRRLHCVDTSDAIQFSTLHAEFKRALNSLSITTDIIDDTTNMRLLREVVAPYCLVNGNGKQLNSEDYRSLQGALTYTRNRLDDKKYKNDVYDEMNLTSVLIDRILRDWRAARLKEGVYDFEDLQEKLYEECYVRNNQEVINYLANRYNFIYIDEFQDTSQIQYALLKIYGGSAKQVVAIGDDDQTIYSWRGSYNGIITKDFIKDFNPIKNDLSVNFRCPSNVLNAIKPSIALNTVRFDKDLRSYREGGKCRYGGYSTYRDMVSALSDMVSKDVNDGKSVAVICRVNSDGLMPALILDKMSKVNFAISGDGMTLDSYIGRLVVGIVRLFTDRATSSVRNALNLLTWDSYCVNNLLRVCKNNKLSIWTINEKDLAYSCPSIASTLIDWRNWRKDLGDVQALRFVLQHYRLNVFTKPNQFNDVVKSVISSVETLLDYYNYDCVEDFLNELQDINERLKARKKKVGTQVRIATVHEFKGKEADSVYIWNDSEGIFPYRDAEDNFEQFEEERRIHYIACTRAREVSTVMYLRSKPGEFVKEMDLSNAENISNILKSGETMAKLQKRMREEANLEKFEEHFVNGDDGTEDNPFFGLEDDGE